MDVDMRDDLMGGQATCEAGHEGAASLLRPVISVTGPDAMVPPGMSPRSPHMRPFTSSWGVTANRARELDGAEGRYDDRGGAVPSQQAPPDDDGVMAVDVDVDVDVDGDVDVDADVDDVPAAGTSDVPRRDRVSWASEVDEASNPLAGVRVPAIGKATTNLGPLGPPKSTTPAPDPETLSEAQAIQLLETCYHIFPSLQRSTLNVRMHARVCVCGCGVGMVWVWCGCVYGVETLMCMCGRGCACPCTCLDD